MTQPNDTATLEAYAAMEAQKHRAEQGGGCICGFCMWSIEHVVIMSIRDGWGLAVRDQRLSGSAVVPADRCWSDMTLRDAEHHLVRCGRAPDHDGAHVGNTGQDEFVTWTDEHHA